ncbi:MAG: UvrD-helicase domain-containing protein [Candidatus Berkelbacteria bacterium]|nr:MAG: UvrD-helicase domain-containing protein [Candidatus Berkelbacteria bacterium]QQG51574.1 MAG: UvrD-helicase domain-containing protein [Candidatus Berkelbacteria bacterium]
MPGSPVSEAVLGGLNLAQKEAVLATDGPVLILAGAGSGKTKCLTHRLAYIVAEGKAETNEILAITFTNKAAQELAGRIVNILGLSLQDFQRNPNLFTRRYLPWVGTFHSICVRILRAEHEQLGLPKSFTIFDSDDSLTLTRGIIRNLGYDPKQISPNAVRSVISGAKNELLSPEDYSKYVQGYFQQVALEVYRKYQRRLVELSALDFDDLIMATVKLLEQFPEVRAKYHQQFKYVMVDEYQDTNHAQYRLTALLTNPKSQNLCVVGDDYQSIYGWRGANFQNILNFNRDFPASKVYKLEQNYRSTKNIILGAAQVVERIKRRSEKKLWTDNEEGPPISVYEASNAYAEAEFVATEIRGLKGYGHNWNDFAVLYRTNAQSRILEEIFLSQGVPYRLVGALRFYERKEVKDLLSYLRYLANPGDTHSFERAINTPPRGIGPKTLEKGGEKVDKFKDDMEQIRTQAASLTPVEILEKVLAFSRYKSFVDDGTPEGEGRVENVEELVNLASEFESLDEFMEHVTLISDVDNYDARADAVTLMSMHASKGLEFTVVFLAGCEEGLFPHMRALEEEAEMDEERRLCYVAMTRARKRLYLTLARQRVIHGGLTNTIPSRFIREIDQNLLDMI